MHRYCAVCGRRLIKTDGPIGPVCKRRMLGLISRRKRMSKKTYIKMMKKYDLFGGKHGS